MKLMKVIRIFGFITLLSVIYIHLQMQIFDLAYQGKHKEQKVRDLHELNGNETYTILKLKSANNLGYQLLAENSEMKFRDETQIVTIHPPASNQNQSQIKLSAWKERTDAILSFLSLGSSAEARPQK